MSAAFSPDGNQVVSAGVDDSIKVWEVATSKLLWQRKHTADVNYASFSPNGDFILSASADQKACIWTAKDGQLVAVLLHGSYLNYATFSPDGRQVVTAGRDGMARVWDRASRELVTLSSQRRIPRVTTCSLAWLPWQSKRQLPGAERSSSTS